MQGVRIPGWARGVGEIVVYRVEARQADGGEDVTTLHRFSDFIHLHKQLKIAFPRNAALPNPPSKKLLANVNKTPSLIALRRKELEEWMGALLEDGDVAASPEVGAFLQQKVAATAGRRAAGLPTQNVERGAGSSSRGSGEAHAAASAGVSDADGHWAAQDVEGMIEGLQGLRPGERAGLLRAIEAQAVEARADMEATASRLAAEAATSRLLANEVEELEGRLGAVEEAMRRAVAVEREARNEAAWQLEEARAAEAAAREEARSAADAREGEARRADVAELERQVAATAAAEAEERLAAAEEEAKAARAVHKSERRLLRQEVLSLRDQLSRAEASRADGLAAARASAEAAAAAAASRAEQQLLREVASLRAKLAACAMEKMAAEEEAVEQGEGGGGPSLDTDRALEVLAASDDRVQCLLAEAQLLATTEEQGGGGVRRAFRDVLSDAAQLRRHTNGMLRSALLQAEGAGAAAAAAEAAGEPAERGWLMGYFGGQ